MLKQVLFPSIYLFLLLLALDQTSCSIDTIPTVVKAVLNKSNYNKNQPPLTNATNSVKYTLELDAMNTIDDKNSQVTVIIIEFFRWQDKRLAYQSMNLTEITAYHKSHWIDLQYARDLIWKPAITYTSLVDVSIESEQFYLYPTGNVDWVRKISLTVKCPFNYKLFPNDEQECLITPFSARQPKSILNLTEYQVDLPLTIVPSHEVVTTSSAPNGYFSFAIELEYLSPLDIYNDLDGSLNSALSFKLKLKRQPFFYMVYYIIPSFIFVIISYSSFWIDQESVTARCSLAITTVLITINFSNGINSLLPPINYEVWLSSYFTAVLIFNCVAMIEYVFVNFCQFNYKTRQQHVNDSMNLIRANLSKYKRKLLKKLDHYKSQNISIQEEQPKATGLRINIRAETGTNLHTETGLMTQLDTNPNNMFRNFFNDKDQPITIVNNANKAKAGQILTSGPKKDIDDMNASELIDEEFKIEEERQQQQQQNQQKRTTRSSNEEFVAAHLDSSEKKLSSEGAYSSQEIDEKAIEKSLEEQRRRGSNVQESQFREYHFRLAYHIEEMENAQKGSNPAKNILVFNEFMLFVVNFWPLVDLDLDSKTRTEIESVFIIENSKAFLLYKFVSENVDNFFRFAYISIYMLYLGRKIAVLYSIPWLDKAVIVIFCFSFVMWTIGVIVSKMKQERWKFRITCAYYLAFECIFPRRKRLVLKLKEEPKKVEKKVIKKKPKKYI